MENNDLDNNNHKRELELIAERRKLLKTEKELLKIKIARDKNKKSQSKFGWKEFWTFIFPALLQILAAAIGVFILIKSSFWDANNLLQEAKNVQLQNQQDTLSSKKSRLDSNIKALRKDSTSKQQQLAWVTTKSLELEQKNKGLSVEMSNQKTQISNLRSLSYKDVLENYRKGIFELEDLQVKRLIELSNQNHKDKKIIQAHIINIMNETPKNIAEKSVTKVKFSSLYYFCFRDRRYRALFLDNLQIYLSENSKNFQEYPYQFLSLLYSNRWSIKEIDENFEYLLKDKYYSNAPLKMAQVSLWASYFFMKNYGNKNGVNFTYLPKVHSSILNELSFLTGSENEIDGGFVGQQMDAYKRSIKNNLIALFSECPQCYIAIAAEVMYKNLPVIADQLKDGKDSITMTMKFINGKIRGTVFVPFLRIELLLRDFDFQGFAPDLYEQYKKVIKANDFPTIDNYQDINDYSPQFKKFYEQNAAKIKYWSSKETLKYINTKRHIEGMKKMTF